MFEKRLSVDESDINYEKKVEDFAKELLKEIENYSKMFGITVNQIETVMSVRK